MAANGAPAFGQYKPTETGEGYEPWALQVLEVDDGRIVELTFFLDTETVFPLFGLPLQFEAVAPAASFVAGGASGRLGLLERRRVHRDRAPRGGRPGRGSCART